MTWPARMPTTFVGGASRGATGPAAGTTDKAGSRRRMGRAPAGRRGPDNRHGRRSLLCPLAGPCYTMRAAAAVLDAAGAVGYRGFPAPTDEPGKHRVSTTMTTAE